MGKGGPPSSRGGEEVGISPDFVELALAEEAILELEGGGCQVSIRAPVRRSRRVNGVVGMAISGIGAAAGFGFSRRHFGRS
ncbi:MAG: hypothetical protein HKO65_01695 [Gemmatimonadetes bacterium]|nr:hypothetical protein [Gemmatimonadota bacterium]NNM03788.1 hypothetical protein [Gemmatimonadota bacterium]